MDLSKLIYGFVKVVKWNCQSFSMYFPPLAKQNQAEVWPRFYSLLKPLPWTKSFEKLKYSIPWVRFAFGNVYMNSFTFCILQVLGRWRWLVKWSLDPSNSRQVGFFSAGKKNVGRRRNMLYFSVITWIFCRYFSESGKGPSSFRGSIMNSWVRKRNVAQAAPVLLVADALLTLLTVQVASIEVSKFFHEVTFFAAIVLQQFFFADGSTLQYWLPVLHAAGGQTNRCQTQCSFRWWLSCLMNIFNCQNHYQYQQHHHLRRHNNSA